MDVSNKISGFLHIIIQQVQHMAEHTRDRDLFGCCQHAILGLERSNTNTEFYNECSATNNNNNDDNEIQRPWPAPECWGCRRILTMLQLL